MAESKHLIVSITWNSNHWKGVAKDTSGHTFVKEGGWPHESYNFDFDNKRNDDKYIYGYFQWRVPPNKYNNGNMVFFASRNYDKEKSYIVGVYGKTYISKEHKFNDGTNLRSEKGYTIFFENYEAFPLDDKEKYLDGKERVGQIGFNYLSDETAMNILDHAIEIHENYTQIKKKLKRIKEFYISDIENYEITMKVWNRFRDYVLLRMGKGERWLDNLRHMFEKYGGINKNNLKTLSDEDINELWFSNNHISHIQYFLKKDPLSLYREATSIISDKDKPAGELLVDAINLFNSDKRYKGKKPITGQIANVIRSLFTIHDINFSVITLERMSNLLTFFNYPVINKSELAHSFTDAIEILSRITNLIAEMGKIEDYNKRMIMHLLWEGDVVYKIFNIAKEIIIKEGEIAVGKVHEYIREELKKNKIDFDEDTLKLFDTFLHI